MVSLQRLFSRGRDLTSLSSALPRARRHCVFRMRPCLRFPSGCASEGISAIRTTATTESRDLSGIFSVLEHHRRRSLESYSHPKQDVAPFFRQDESKNMLVVFLQEAGVGGVNGNWFIFSFFHLFLLFLSEGSPGCWSRLSLFFFSSSRVHACLSLRGKNCDLVFFVMLSRNNRLWPRKSGGWVETASPPVFTNGTVCLF